MDEQVRVSGQAAGESGVAQIIAELREWQVFKVAAAYAVIGWLIVQVVATIGPAFDLPEWVLRAIVLALIAGFLLTMGFMLFRSRGSGRVARYLSGRARTAAIAGVLLIAAVAAALSIRSLTAREQISLAVLPFTDLSPAQDKSYFAEGVAEEILGTLAAERDIKVLGRTSARQIERNPDPKVVRASLGVTHLLEGSTRTAGNDLRVNVRLIDTSDGSQVWEEEYRGALSDVFKVQDDIATAVVRRMRGTFFGSAVRNAERTAIGAYESYLAGRALIRENKREAIKRSWETAAKLVEAHPDYAPGHALFAETTILLSDGPYGYGGMPQAKARQLALPHARKAIQLTPERAEGYAALGLVLPVEQSIAPYRKALSIDPSRADVRLRLALAYDLTKRVDQAFDQYRLTVETEPLAPAFINRYIQILGSSGRGAEALQVIDQFERRGGSQAQAWRFRGAIYAYQGDLSRSIAARQRALKLDPGLPYQRDWLVQKLHFLGLDERIGPYREGVPPAIGLFASDDRGALKAHLLKYGAGAWTANGVEFGIFSLARSRDWRSMAAFYDMRPPEMMQICAVKPSIVPLIAMGLAQQDRGGEARKLADCTARQVEQLLKMRFRSPDDMPGELEVTKASLLALNSDERAFEWLDKAVRRGWLGQYYSASLADWPPFDRYSADPRLAALQQRIRAKVEQERREVLASKE